MSERRTPTTSANERHRPGVAAVTRLRVDRAGSEPSAQPALQGTLALAQSENLRPAPQRPGAATRDRPDLRLVDGGQASTRAWTVRFFQVLVEVLGGDRSPQQMVRSTSPEVFADLVRRCELLSRASSSRTGSRSRTVRAQVRSVRVCQPSPFVAEVCARVQHGERSRAVAGRLELVDGRWRCTALELG